MYRVVLKKSIFIFCIFSIILLCGCNKKKDVSIKFKKIGSDEIIICSDSFDLRFPKEGGLTDRRLRFPILAGKKVNQDDIKITIDNFEYEVNIEKDKVGDFEYFTYLSYTDVDWNKYTRLYKTDMKAFKKYDKKFVEAYEKFEKSRLPKFDVYVVDIVFSSDILTGSIDKISVKYKEKEYFLKGNIEFTQEDIPETNIDCFNDYGLAYDEVTLIPSIEGKYLYDFIKLQTNKDIEILDVTTVEGTKLNVNKVNVVSSGEQVSDRVLTKGSPIRVASNSMVELKVELERTEKTKVFSYTCNPILLIKYRVDGMEYYANVNTISRTIMSSYELYAKYVDDKKIEDYYSTFYQALL